MEENLQTAPKKNHFVYRHLRGNKFQGPKTGTPFYIGKGIKPKRYKSHQLEFCRAYSQHGRNNIWHSIVAKYGYEIEILVDDLTEREALDKEMELIKLYGRVNTGTGILCNLTDGGEGNAGWKPRPETCEKISKAAIGRKNPHSEATKLAIGAGNKGRIVTQVTRDKMRKTQEGRKQSPKQIAAARRGLVEKYLRKVVCLQTGIVFDCAQEAGTSMYPHKSNAGGYIADYCHGVKKIKSVYGSTFAYA